MLPQNKYKAMSDSLAARKKSHPPSPPKRHENGKEKATEINQSFTSLGEIELDFDKNEAQKYICVARPVFRLQQHCVVGAELRA